LYKERGGADM